LRTHASGQELPHNSTAESSHSTALSTRSRRCRFFCPTDRLPCKLPLAGVVVEIKIRENQPFADFYRRCEEDSSRMAGLKNAAACSRPEAEVAIAKKPPPNLD
jgi:hypothetical protein